MFNSKSLALFSALCYIPLVLSWTDWRYAKFYDCSCPSYFLRITIAYSSLAADCSGKGGKGVNMENNGCLRQRNRHSVSLGGDLAKYGLFCMVRYKDGECKCIEGGKLYYQWPTLGPDYCENEDTEKHLSFHFERIDDFNVSPEHQERGGS